MSSNAKSRGAKSAAAPSGAGDVTADSASGTSSAPPPEFPDVAQLSYEAARDELVAIVARLEAGEAGLEESMKLWRRGEALAAHCSTWLDDAESSLHRAGDGGGDPTER